MSRKTSGGCWDLRDLQESEKLVEAFSRLVSGKHGYKTIIERKKELQKCKNCGFVLEGSEKFCPECGTKIEKINYKNSSPSSSSSE